MSFAKLSIFRAGNFLSIFSVTLSYGEAVAVMVVVVLVVVVRVGVSGMYVEVSSNRQYHRKIDHIGFVKVSCFVYSMTVFVFGVLDHSHSWFMYPRSPE